MAYLGVITYLLTTVTFYNLAGTSTCASFFWIMGKNWHPLIEGFWQCGSILTLDFSTDCDFAEIFSKTFCCKSCFGSVHASSNKKWTCKIIMSQFWSCFFCFSFNSIDLQSITFTPRSLTQPPEKWRLEHDPFLLVPGNFSRENSLLKSGGYPNSFQLNPGCLGFFQGWNPTQLCGDYNEPL